MEFKRLILTNALRCLAFFGVLFLCLFVSAGRLDLPFFWAYICVTAGWTMIGYFTIDPGLQEERWKPAVRNTGFWVALIIGICYPAHWLVSGLDVGRFHWSPAIPVWVQTGSLIVHAASWGLVWRSMVANMFFSTVVRIQTERRHHLVTSGPYAVVRHPGYTGAITGFLSSPIALGSWWALVVILPVIVLIFYRTASEDRFLHRELEGYQAYADRVHNRLLPGVW